ncbi:MAG: GTPase Era [Bacteroidia bacterium]|nr:GTPase Era [Bacteroidia bacterium]
MFKTAFITILGLPNAGKSTFLNAVLGEDLVITNAKAQTTRHRIKGILNEENYQLVFSDTPGIIHESAYKLQEAMMGAVSESLEDADAVLLILDAQYPKVEEFKAYAEKINCPIVVALNKVDLVEDQEVLQRHVEATKSAFKTEHVFAISAKENFNTSSIISTLVDLAPEHPAFYDKESLTDENVRFLVSEMIREQILTQFKKEIPYSVEVVISDYKEKEKIDEIYATVYVERDSQRVIMLGRGGKAIKSLGIESRKRIESFIKKHVFLSLTIKVRKDWRKDDNQLKNFGYLK